MNLESFYVFAHHHIMTTVNIVMGDNRLPTTMATMTTTTMNDGSFF